MDEIGRIVDEIARAYDGDAWHGPSLHSLLAGVTAAEAAARPVPGAHSIWELTLHLGAWMEEIRRRLGTGRAAEPAEGDWPPVGEASEAAWRRVREQLDERHRALLADVAALPASRLQERIPRLHQAPGAAGVTVYTTVAGILQHGVYHAGQIALLKKALRH